MAESHPVIRISIAVLALVGLVDAFYFTFAYYGRVRKSRWVPEVLCAREGSSCVTVVQTPYARVFGVPNSLLGIFYYLLIIGYALWGQGLAIPWGRVLVPLSRLLAVISAATVVFGSYLIYALRRKLGVDCSMCYTAHAINAALLVLLILSCQ
jgi:uncharacterized membrane protein